MTTKRAIQARGNGDRDEAEAKAEEAQLDNRGGRAERDRGEIAPPPQRLLIEEFFGDGADVHLIAADEQLMNH